MSRSIFGWDLPPGCSMRDIERSMGMDEPCEVCGAFPVDDCICPECKVCGAVGDPNCYDSLRAQLKYPAKGDFPHGLIVTLEQANNLQKAEAQWEAEAKAEDEYYKEMAKADSIFDEE